MTSNGTTAPSQADTKIFVASTVGMALAIWDVAFNLGAFNTVFFDKIFMVWVASTAALLASLFVQRPTSQKQFLSWRGRFVLLLPTVWVVLQLAAVGTLVGDKIELMTLVFGILCTLITLPYTIYVLVLIVTPDLDNLESKRLIGAMILTVTAIGTVGFFVGQHNNLFLTCRDFVVSGNDTPHNCQSGSISQSLGIRDAR